ncbi:MAG: HNH endonuclease [Nanoarchaeota archaeon]|nr:HNH endonuclease [Nanoarchaeota archaeon]
MQKLKERNTYTPTVIPQDCSNCGLSLNSPEGRGSVAGLKTSFNSSDAALTGFRSSGTELESICYKNSFLVYVLNQKGYPLMPCSPRKAKMLLKEGKAKVAGRSPFTIQLTTSTGEARQDITLGVDSGYSHVGLSAVSRKQELFSAEVSLRDDMVKLNSERRQYRRSRRSRKTWYRKPRFLNRKKDSGWLAPSIQHKLDSSFKLISKIKEILPIAKINVEVAAFDIQKIKNPDIEGEGYQNGVQKNFWNTREYVIFRDNHICQICNGSSKDPVLEVHHLESRQTGGDRPDNLITLCSSCHSKVSKGKTKLTVKSANSFKAETFMNTVRWKLVNKLIELGNNVSHTYGYITKNKRIELGLAKSHSNDAFIIAGGNRHKRATGYIIQQVRKCNRKLFKGSRSHIRNTAPRFVKGFQRFDKVLWKGIECFVFGRRKTGYFDIRMLTGEKLSDSAKYSQLKLLESAKTLLIERRMALLPSLTEGVSEPCF